MCNNIESDIQIVCGFVISCYIYLCAAELWPRVRGVQYLVDAIESFWSFIESMSMRVEVHDCENDSKHRAKFMVFVIKQRVLWKRNEISRDEK